MASLVIVAAIIVAVKSPDWIEQYKQHKAKKAGETDSDSTLPPDYFGPSPDATETATGKRSKRDLLTRKYWHERRESRQSREQIQSPEMRATADRRGSFEAPPPYNGPPGYQEDQKREHDLELRRNEQTVYFHCP